LCYTRLANISKPGKFETDNASCVVVDLEDTTIHSEAQIKQGAIYTSGCWLIEIQGKEEIANLDVNKSHKALDARVIIYAVAKFGEVPQVSEE
jgi:hypothetical protein